MKIIIAIFLLISATGWGASWPAKVPKILSASDVQTYQNMFHYQRMLQREKAAKLIPELENKILLGHVVAERLTHPQTKIPYPELQSWLAKYGDHHQASSIYKLANKRKPKSASRPKKPSNKNSSAVRYSDPDILPRVVAPATPNNTKPKLEKRLKSNLKYGRLNESFRLLSRPSARIVLGGDNWSKAINTLARKLIEIGQFNQAYTLTAQAAKYKTAKQLESLWLSGFAAFQAKKGEESALAFRALVYAAPANSRAYSRAAYWAGRAYTEIDKTKLAQVFFAMAAQNITTFYGQIAQESLENSLATSNPKITWKNPKTNPSDLKKLGNFKAIKRVIALAQIGEYSLAQKELRSAYASLPKGMDETLLALSIHLNLPNTAYTLAHNLKNKNKVFLSGLYPVPSKWRPLDGFTADPALLFAIMRQESIFDPDLVSSAGAQGLMQIMPRTADYIRKKQGKFTLPKYFVKKPAVNLGLAQWYLNYLQAKTDGNLLHTLTAYNAGPGNLRKWQGNSNLSAGDPLLFVESIPFTETRNYVKKVLANLWMYKSKFNQPTPLRLALSRHTWGRAVALNE